MSGCCAGPDYEGLRAKWQEYHAKQSAVEQTILRTAFQSIRSGIPLPVATLADGTGSEDESRQAALNKLAEQGLITLSPSGDTITGASGLSTAPSRHRLRLNGIGLYTWCALDAVGIPAALEADALVESRCGTAERPLLLEFQSGRLVRASHPDALVWVVPPEAERSVCGFT